MKTSKEKVATSKMSVISLTRDNELIDMLNTLSLQWNSMSKFDKVMMFNLLQWKESKKAFTNKQVSVITSMFMNYRSK